MKYEEFNVTDGKGNNLGYFKTYNEAISKVNEQTQAKIYGKRWFPSKCKGLMHLDWEEIK